MTSSSSSIDGSCVASGLICPSSVRLESAVSSIRCTGIRVCLAVNAAIEADQTDSLLQYLVDQLQVRCERHHLQAS